MATILNIDTSSSQCSVSLAIDGEIVVGLESYTKMDHSVSLAPFVEQCITYLREKRERLEAVSVIYGPGSYTGLRIGLSMAKGIAFGYGIPLITLSTLEVMAVRAIFNYQSFEGDELIIPMVDARRMEVFTGVYDSTLTLLEPEQSMILTNESFKHLSDKIIIFIGDGSEKFKSLFQEKNNVIWMGPGMAHAKYMSALSEKYYKEKKFSDVAYATPSYLKEYQATKSKKVL